MLLKNIPVDPDELPEIGEIPHHGHPRVFRKELILLSAIPYVILLAGPVVLAVLGEYFWALLAVILVLILFGISVLIIYKSFPVRAYALRELDISYRKGWIFFSNITVPFVRIQHSEISQGPIDRLFGLVTLHIYTAGGSSSDLSIPGLPRDEAQRLRDYIAGFHE